jgi:rubrerythrin
MSKVIHIPIKKDERWVCKNCGYIHKGKNPPKKCPKCKESLFERKYGLIIEKRHIF